MSNPTPFQSLIAQPVVLLVPGEAKSGRPLAAGLEGVVVAELRVPHTLIIRCEDEFIDLPVQARGRLFELQAEKARDDGDRPDGSHDPRVEH
jgi:hypothetical protein